MHVQACGGKRAEGCRDCSRVQMSGKGERMWGLAGAIFGEGQT